MKETIVRACGHQEVVEVFGSAKERAAKLKWLASFDCEDCKNAAKAVDCKEVEMHYSEYKTNYANCETKKGSYDKKTKTIVVYVPVEKVDESEATDEPKEEKTADVSETIETPKYNKSNIMRRAWELYRKASGSFGECLKYAWAEAKGIVKKLIDADVPENSVFEVVIAGAKGIQDRLAHAKANLMHIAGAKRVCLAFERAIAILA